MSPRRVLLFFILALTATFSTAQPASSTPATLESALKNLKLRPIGPAIMGGRIDDLTALEGDSKVIYIGAATGGVWRSNDGGATWTSLFDEQANPSVGALAVAPSNPSVIYVGTGEANNRQSASWGDGVYKSTDGGKTWMHVGLDRTQSIGRIVIDPANADVAYVAALGGLWGPNPERGVFKTSDGGRTWQKVLYINDDTGVSDIAMDPKSPTTLYAGAYERRRTAWGFNGGGPHGGVYKSIDGGATWNKITEGLPNKGDIGRIGLAVYRRDPSIVYALVQNNDAGGVYRSEDRGVTWRKMSATNPRPSYFSQIRIDPNNDLRIWLGGVDLFYSDDGGKTFSNQRVKQVHSDFHALWIDPNDSNYMLAGCDGGVYVSHDAGRNWDHLNLMPLGQAYEVGFDMQQPYHLCAGYQDNAEWCGPSRTWFDEGIPNSDWLMVGGGDGFFVKPDPEDPNTIYTESQDGNMSRKDLRTNEVRSIRPLSKVDDPPYRFNWNTPFLISAHNHNTLYIGGNYLFKSMDRGDTWTRLGGDLTSGVNRNDLPILGVKPSRETLSLYDGVQWYPSSTAIAESPLNAQVLWVGTDDGNLQLSRDGGQTWKNMIGSVPGVPRGTYVSRILASKHNEGTAYVAFDGHRSNDFHVYLFKTTNFGGSWTPLTSGMSDAGGTLHVIREHPSDPNLLFAGAEFGAYYSQDGGAHWNKLKLGLPTVPVDDIQIHPRENDLILATHGRSLWILDDLTPLQQLTTATLGEELRVFPIRNTVAWRMANNTWFTAQQYYAGPNPPYGALISFYLKNKPAEKQKVKVTITDASGKAIREIEYDKAEAGVNRINWDLRYDAPVKPTEEQLAAQAQGFFGGGARGIMVDPGTYNVKVEVGSASQTTRVTIEEDPRIQISAGDRAARHELAMQLMDDYRKADAAQKQVTGLRRSLEGLEASWRQPDAVKPPEALQKQTQDTLKALLQAGTPFIGRAAAEARPGQGGQGGPGGGGGGGGAGGPLNYYPPALPQQIGRVMFELDRYTAAPSATEKEEVADIEAHLGPALDNWKKVVDGDIANLNKALNEANIPRVVVLPPGPQRPQQGETDTSEDPQP
ncbi:MAG TPA: hypothetical protein VE998_05280 [Terriglobales bacterium]|nr:hypothetical protein [Terriglobales bacterium]